MSNSGPAVNERMERRIATVKPLIRMAKRQEPQASERTAAGAEILSGTLGIDLGEQPRWG